MKGSSDPSRDGGQKVMMRGAKRSIRALSGIEPETSHSFTCFFQAGEEIPESRIIPLDHSALILLMFAGAALE